MRTKGTTSSKATRRRAPRRRPTPRWLTGREDLDQIAQRRCLLVLSVLSGEKPVTTAIAELGISRPLYYQLETKAIVAMLTALAPGASAAESPDEASPANQRANLEAKIAELEQDKRRLERLLFLTRKILPQGPIVTPSKRGRPAGTKNRTSTTDGAGPSRSSTSSTTTTRLPSPSTPTPDGATTP